MTTKCGRVQKFTIPSGTVLLIELPPPALHLLYKFPVVCLLQISLANCTGPSVYRISYYPCRDPTPLPSGNRYVFPFTALCNRFPAFMRVTPRASCQHLSARWIGNSEENTRKRNELMACESWVSQENLGSITGRGR